eukprot:962381-Rhodomonas_salina.1
MVASQLEWGTWCKGCQHWGQPVNPPLSFNGDTYVRQPSKESKWSHQGSIAQSWGQLTKRTFSKSY